MEEFTVGIENEKGHDHLSTSHPFFATLDFYEDVVRSG